MPFYRAHVLVCNGTPCILKGSRAVQTALVDEIKKKGLENEIKVVETGCLGISEVGPVMVVYPEGITYCGVTVNDVPTIVEEHLLKGRVVERLVYKERTASHVSAAAASRSREQRVVLKNVGSIDPTSIEEYIAVGGYEAMGKALTQMTPLEVIKAVKDSGLRGRGGAAFPTGLKWELTADAPGENKTIVCNADEGEPGNFKDRLILEGDPHSIVEAMIIAGYAIGANKGYVYIRGEYHQSVSHLERAIAVAREMELLGEDILGSRFNFDIEVFKGAGAYICGEETALLESLEGTRGESRMKPPYPPTSGLHGQPTVINNVETLANIPQIIANGAEWFASIGTEKSKGTKIFSPCGDVLYPGVYEVPFGTTMREVIYEMAGGIKSGKDLKAVLIGGPSGICISKEDLDRQFAFEDLPPGAGALIVIDEDKCIVDIMQNCAKFFLHESCGQCVPCREGTKRLYELFTWWQGGAGSPGDLALAQSLGDVMSVSAKCGLGQFAATAFRTSLPLFEEEYRAHVVDRVCPSGVCKMNNGCESEVV
ncbi:MAG TPA: NADH-ubiquinone oxidoreductase-F iron-sulfur binding region domain-containing protein, partial [Armatimonadota bacterium]|nr:NADH-ubiquinone oxidoreductase-F iron-sulfur binding region domain-containing protein [Armatimonadota bacterium]HOP79346.1 NADH-ubiquinone oxidoreductase-F iron-sulfur binding region domain-containing protein [Armatimonadota bacterium]